ncbi:MAG: hypothetical protein TEF_12595 [Rhizobiales bacterium NRL2]|jgi:transcriptional regulator with XRE-family HTH domain|nr:MAG: hypothetical protein TEF_03970 [Rhizobiales bacterium NRL2]ANK81536.1 MAG: hypothetical protein TEF_12595 [Rhizobiales bacterium NRL2]
MQNELSLDLRVARRQAGLTQADCGHLLGIDASRVSKIEKGKRQLLPLDMCALALIYGRPMDSLYAPLIREAEVRIGERFPTLPAPPSRWAGTFNRQQTLSALAERLEASQRRIHGG